MWWRAFFSQGKGDRGKQNKQSFPVLRSELDALKVLNLLRWKQLCGKGPVLQKVALQGSAVQDAVLMWDFGHLLDAFLSTCPSRISSMKLHRV